MAGTDVFAFGIQNKKKGRCWMAILKMDFLSTKISMQTTVTIFILFKEDTKRESK